MKLYLLKKWDGEYDGEVIGICSSLDAAERMAREDLETLNTEYYGPDEQQLFAFSNIVGVLHLGDAPPNNETTSHYFVDSYVLDVYESENDYNQPRSNT